MPSGTTLVLLHIIGAAYAAAQAPYVAIDLHTSPYAFTIANAISEGRIVGQGRLQSADHALSWPSSSSAPIDLHPTMPIPCNAFSQPITTTCTVTRSGYAIGISGSAIVAQAFTQDAGDTSENTNFLLWTNPAGPPSSLRPSAGTGYIYLWGKPTSLGPSSVGPSQFVAAGAFAQGGRRALLWLLPGRGLVDLHPLQAVESFAQGTDGAQQVGWIRLAINTAPHAALWSGSTASFNDLNPPGYIQSIAEAIAGGQQVGWGARPGTANHALRWNGTANSVVDLHPAAGYVQSFAYGTNGTQQVGSVDLPLLGSHAAVWSDTAASFIDLHQFLPAGYFSSGALGIDTNGDIVGWARVGPTPNAYHAVIWKRQTTAPVIIIPGILGTFLKRNQDITWLDPIKACLHPFELFCDNSDSFLNVLELNESGNSDTSIQPDALFDGNTYPLLPPLNVYGPLLSALAREGFVRGQSLFTFPYDWRLSNALNAARLDAFIENVLRETGQQKVDLVAHSMGGLLARRYASSFNRGRIRKLLYLGTPHTGAPKAFGPLAYNSSLAQLLHVPFVNDQTLARLSRTFPSVYELLPRSPFVWARTRTLTLEETYDPLPLGLLKSPNSPRWVTAATEFHQSIVNPLNVAQYQIVGSGLPTITSLSLLTGLTQTPRTFCVNFGNGDGTVPIASAGAAPGAAPTATFYVNAAHDNLPRDSTVAQLVTAILRDRSVTGTPTQPIPIRTGVMEWCTASPVTVSVADANGRRNHVGPDGSTQLAIPESEFSVLEHNEAGFMLATQPYDFLITAKAPGLFSFLLQEKRPDGALTATLSFQGVPVLPSATATMTFTPGGPAPTLAVDIDADGRTDFSVAANTPVTALTSLQGVASIITVLPVGRGLATSLIAKITAAQRAIEQGQLPTARNILTAASNEVLAQAGKGISVTHAQSLRDILTAITTSLAP